MKSPLHRCYSHKNWLQDSSRIQGWCISLESNQNLEKKKYDTHCPYFDMLCYLCYWGMGLKAKSCN